MSIEVVRLDHANAALLASAADEVFDHPVREDMTKRFIDDPGHTMFLALEAGVVVGFVSSVDYLHPDKPTQRWINEVSVAPTHRRRGIGTRLLSAVCDDATHVGCEQIWLATEHDNAPARGLYRAAGWRETPIVMYEPPDSAV